MQLLAAAITVQPALAESAVPGTIEALLALTQIDPALVTIIDLGPFKHKQDLGLMPRKHAFNCLEVRPSFRQSRPCACSQQLAAPPIGARRPVPRG